MTRAALLLLAAVLCLPAQARHHRDHKAISAFKHVHPCPATGKARGACPGYVIDHVQPLACGGADAPGNMQWQAVADAKAKDKIERRGC